MVVALLYMQNDCKPIRTLTINLGLRWSYESPFETADGKQSQFDPTATTRSPDGAERSSHAGALAKKDLNNFQPRLGVAWNFSPKWVFRGNFGIITSDLLTQHA